MIAHPLLWMMMLAGAPGPAWGEGGEQPEVVVQRVERDMAASPTAILPGVCLAPVEQVITRGFSSPDRPRTLTVTGSDERMDQPVTIIGTDRAGEPIEETIRLDGTRTVAGERLFRQVHKIRLPASSGELQIIAIGASRVPGLQAPIPAATDPPQIGQSSAGGTLAGQPCDPHWDVTIGNPGMSSGVMDFLQRDFGEGERVVVSGAFIQPYRLLALWDGQGWAPLDPRFGPASGIVDLEVFDDGNGEKLYALGNMPGGQKLWHLARHDGDKWTYLDNGDPANAVSSMAVWDDGTGPALYVTGDFDTLDGVTAHNSIAKWDGQQWRPLNAGLNFSGTQIGLALQIFDDGSGEQLYLGGDFQKVDGKSIDYLARWDGSEWSDMGNGGPNQTVRDLCVHDDGSGPALYAAGFFEIASGRRVDHVARWDGVQWSDLDGGTEGGGGLYSCVVYDDGAGPALYISGHISSASGKPMCNIAKWDGTEWHDPGGGLECGTTAGAFGFLSAPVTSPFGPSLFTGGSFHQAGGQPTNFIAEYRGCFCLPDWNADGIVNTQDFIAYLNDWAAQDPRADLNSDGTINTIDFIAFLNAWAAGC